MNKILHAVIIVLKTLESKREEAIHACMFAEGYMDPLRGSHMTEE